MRYSLPTFLLLTLLSLHVCGSRPVKQFAKAQRNAPYEVIIVPGVPYDDDDYTELLAKRIKWAVHLYKSGVTRHIIFSGSAVYTPYVESIIMKQYALAYEVPDSVIFTEKRAEHSVENVYYSYVLAREMGFTKIALATDRFQSRMMEWASSNMKVKIDFIPIVEDRLEQVNYGQVQIDPTKAYIPDFVSIEDRESVWERMRGTFGKNVEKKD
ncbi:MAG: YdcF family protein [Bacteroidales bacterium]|jgi:vancomycin permeability regulator SanA